MNNLIPWKRTENRQNGSTQMAPMPQMRWDWDRLFDRFWDDAWGMSSTGASNGMPLDIAEDDDQIRVRAEVPGVDPAHLDISLSGELLTLSGEKSDEDESLNGGSRRYSERHFGHFERAVKLPCAVDPDKVTAKHRNGVVTITLQKADAVRPKRIQIKSA